MDSVILLNYSYGDASIESLQSDVHRIFLGYLIMFAYTVVMLGRQGGLGSRPGQPV